jgi:hypothetical protein
MYIVGPAPEALALLKPSLEGKQYVLAKVD